MRTFDSYLEKKLENPELKKEYDALEPEFSIIQAMIDALTVAENAERMKETEL